jgi:hypothetical protein
MPVRFARVYFVRGNAPGTSRTRNEVLDPPTSGHGHVCILPGEKRSTLLSPFTLQAYQVSNGCDEMRSAVDVEVTPEKLAGHIVRAWEECVKLGFQRDFGVAAMVLTELGQPVPKFLPPPPSADDRRRDEEPSKRGGKPVAEESLRPCRRQSKRGEVAAFFMQEGPQSLLEAMARLGMTRSGVLSHLFTLNKDHGVGYELVGDCASLVVPAGFDLFAYVEPERAERPAATARPEGQPEPRKRTSGKPVVPDVLKPIPEPGKRATVARLFVGGWHDLSAAMATLDLDRSAVLSHLFTINKENGLGYELSEDSSKARLIVPDGHVVFGLKVQRTKKSEG